MAHCGIYGIITAYFFYPDQAPDVPSDDRAKLNKLKKNGEKRTKISNKRIKEKAKKKRKSRKGKANKGIYIYIAARTNQRRRKNRVAGTVGGVPYRKAYKNS